MANYRLKVRTWLKDLGQNREELKKSIESKEKKIPISDIQVSQGEVLRFLKSMKDTEIVLKEDAMFLVKEYILSKNFEAVDNVLNKNEEASGWLNHQLSTQSKLNNNIISPGLFNDCMREIFGEFGAAQTSAQEILAKANERVMGQPYINSTDKSYRVSTLFKDDLLEKYKVQKLESLYLRTDKLTLDNFLADKLQEVSKNGVQEVVIFCSEEHSNLQTSDLNAFLQDNKISINFKVVQLSEQDLKDIDKEQKKLSQEISQKHQELENIGIGEIERKIKDFMSNKPTRLKELVELEMERDRYDENSDKRKKLDDKIARKISGWTSENTWASYRASWFDYLTPTEVLSNIKYSIFKRTGFWVYDTFDEEDDKKKLKNFLNQRQELLNTRKKLEAEKKLLKDKLAAGFIYSAEINNNNKIKYKEYKKSDGTEIEFNLLNNANSHQTILNNQDENVKEIAKEHPFEAKNPNYIIRSSTTTHSDVRKSKSSLGVSLAHGTVVELDQELSQEMNRELEIEVPPSPISVAFQGQMAGLLDRNVAKEKAVKFMLSSFHEYYKTETNAQIKEILLTAGVAIKGVIDRIFDSGGTRNHIAHITEDVLKLIVVNWFLFKDGIVLSNLPLELFFDETMRREDNSTTNILFTLKDSNHSDKTALEIRKHNNSINGLTVILNPLNLKGNPLASSWLYWAKEVGSLDDLYDALLDNNEHKIFDGKHQGIAHERQKQIWQNNSNANDDEVRRDTTSWVSDDRELDLPANKLFSEFTTHQSSDHGGRAIAAFKNIDDDSNLNNTNLQPYVDFGNLRFYGLTQVKKARLLEIKKQLEARSVFDVFIKIISTHYFSDAEFLLQEETAEFFDKLFGVILPATNYNKINFFETILTGCNFIDQRSSFFNEILESRKDVSKNIKPQIGIKAAFEAIDFIYYDIQEFCSKNFGSNLPKCTQLKEQYAKALKNQLKVSNNFKVIAQRLKDLLEDVDSKGDNIGAQLEILSGEDTQDWLQNPVKFSQINQHYNIKIFHPSQKLDELSNVNFDPVSELRNELNKKDSYKTIETSITRFLGSILSFKRASFDTYQDFIVKLEGIDPSNLKEQNCISLDEEVVLDDQLMKRYHQANNDLRTVEYTTFSVPKNAQASMNVFNSANYKKWKKDKNDEFDKVADDQFFATQQSFNEQDPRDDILEYCYPPIAVKGKNANLVTGFTSRQALNNVKLLGLNVLTSIDKNYQSGRPDQDFDAYISLFRVLFEEFIFNDVKIAEKKLKLGKGGLEAEVVEVKLSDKEQKKETDHEEMVNSFINISNEHRDFSFDEVVFLGLVAKIQSEDAMNGIADQLVNLREYYSVSHIGQMLKMILSRSISTGKDYEELKDRVLLGTSILNALNATVTDNNGDDITIHEFLTEYNSNPEHMLLFALYFDGRKDVSYNYINVLVAKLNGIDQPRKDELIESYTKRKLPYDNGEISTNDNISKISLDDLGDDSKINNIINGNNNHHVAENEILNKTKFNDLGFDTKENLPVDLTPLKEIARDNGITSSALPENLKSITFRELKTAINNSQDFVGDVIFSDSHIPQDFNMQLSRSLIELMFKAIETQTGDYEQRVVDEIDLLFDEQSLAQQFSYIEKNKKYFDEIFVKTSEVENKAILRELKAVDPNKKTLNNLLEFLKDIDQSKVTISELITGNNAKILITKYFELFKTTVNSYIKSNNAISLDKLYSVVNNIIKLEEGISSAQKILSYCEKHKDYSMIKIFTNLETYKLDDVTELVNWFTGLKKDDVNQLNDSNYIDFKKIFRIKSVQKIEIIFKIAIGLLSKDDITEDQYNEIVKQVMIHDADYAELLSSCLFAPSSGKNGEITTKEKITNVMSHLESFKLLEENGQKIFSDYRQNRFKLDNTVKKKLSDRIENIGQRATKDGKEAELSAAEKIELYKSATSVYEKFESYSKFTSSSEFKAKAIELKYNRSLLASYELNKIRELDLEFVALSVEAMYRANEGKFPRDIQVLAVLNSIIRGDISIIHEIATGEGKSIIAAVLGAYFVYTGKTVDIGTSAVFAADEAIDEFVKFYDSLGIKYSLDSIRDKSDVSDYIKNGVNYGKTSALALFFAGIDLEAKDNSVESKTDRVFIGDEIDYMALTEAFIHYIIAILAKMNIDSAELKALDMQIADFVKTDKFKSIQVSRKDDIENLKKYLLEQFQDKTSFAYEFNKMTTAQINDLKRQPATKDMYYLYMAYSKLSSQDSLMDVVLSEFLNGAAGALKLMKNPDLYVLPSDADLQNAKDGTLQIYPRVGAQKAPEGVYYSKSVQAFLQIMVEKNDSKYKNKFKMPSVTDTVSHKDFSTFLHKYYDFAIGMTGTAGNEADIGEFREHGFAGVYEYPRYETDLGKTSILEVSDYDEQKQKMLTALNKDSDRPVIIFADNASEAKKIYDWLKNSATGLNNSRAIELYAESQDDTLKTGKIAVALGGTQKTILITTSVLGRAADFKTSYCFTTSCKDSTKDGILGLDIAESVTERDSKQIEGRSARNGFPGENKQIYDKSQFPGKTIKEHRAEIEAKHRDLRTKSRVNAQIADYFGQYYEADPENGRAKPDYKSAGECNKFINSEWEKLLEENQDKSAAAKETLTQLRKKLIDYAIAQCPDQDRIAKAINKYAKIPNDDSTQTIKDDINRYLDEINKKPDFIEGKECNDNIFSIKDSIPALDTNTQAKSYKDITCQNIQNAMAWFNEIPIDYGIHYVEQTPLNPPKITSTNWKLGKNGWRSWIASKIPAVSGISDWWYGVNTKYQSTHISSFEKPTEQNTYQAYYNKQYKSNLLVTSAHVYDMENSQFDGVTPEYYIHLSDKNELIPRWMTIDNLVYIGMFGYSLKQSVPYLQYIPYAKSFKGLPKQINDYIEFHGVQYKGFVWVLSGLLLKNGFEHYSGFNLFDNRFVDYFAYLFESLEREEAVIYSDNQKLYYRTKNGRSVEITKFMNAFDGAMSKKPYENLYTTFSDDNFKSYELSAQERKAILDIALKDKKIEKQSLDAADIQHNVMHQEFKGDFSLYQKWLKKEKKPTKLIEKINNLVTNFVNVQDLDIEKLVEGEYQAIEITTKDGNCETETILTDGKLLFWSGVGLYKLSSDIFSSDIFFIKRSLRKIKNKAGNLTQKFFRDEMDQILFDSMLIRKIDEETGQDKYCSWNRNIEILKAMATVVTINDNLNDFLNPKDEKLLKAIKDAKGIYKKFVNFVKILQAEKIVSLFDKNFEFQILDKDTDLIKDNVVSHDVVEKFLNSFKKDIKQFNDTIYKNHVQKILKAIELEYALNSKLGRALQNNDYYLEDEKGITHTEIKQKIKEFLAKYQESNSLDHFVGLEEIYKDLVTTNQNDTAKNYGETAFMHEFIRQVSISDTKCYIYDKQDLGSKWNLFQGEFGNCLNGSIIPNTVKTPGEVSVAIQDCINHIKGSTTFNSDYLCSATYLG